jgi:hypothetical protein
MGYKRIGLIIGLCLVQFSMSMCAQAQTVSPAIATPTIPFTPTPGCPSPEALKNQSPAWPSLKEDLPGHGSRNGDGYRLFGKNCHNASNAFARRDFSRNGIVLCDQYGHHKDNPNYAGGHTFNWRVSEPDSCGIVEVCFYNWTVPCCYKTQAFGQGEAPHITGNGAAEYCVQAFCPDEFKPGNPVAYPPGKLVEDAGWLGCVKTAAGGLPNTPAGNLDFAPSIKKESACKKCCTEKEAIIHEYWLPPVTCIDDSTREKVLRETEESLRECERECTKYFHPPAVPTPTRTPAPSASPMSRR